MLELAAAFFGGIIFTVGSIIALGNYAVRKPELLAPIAKRVTHAMLHPKGKK